MCYINTLKQEHCSAKNYDLLDERYVVDRHQRYVATEFGVFVDEVHSNLHALYWLPKLYKKTYNSCFIAK